MVPSTSNYSARHAERRYQADQLARECGVQPSVADWWLWMRWMLANGKWDTYHAGNGRAWVWANQELESERT